MSATRASSLTGLSKTGTNRPDPYTLKNWCKNRVVALVRIPAAVMGTAVHIVGTLAFAILSICGGGQKIQKLLKLEAARVVWCSGTIFLAIRQLFFYHAINNAEEWGIATFFLGDADDRSAVFQHLFTPWKSIITGCYRSVDAESPDEKGNFLALTPSQP